ncbi:MAG TPA: MFS transporter [Anaerolineales bacterium]
MPASASPQRTIDLIGMGIVLSLLGDATLYTVLPDPGIAAAAGISLSVVGLVLGLNRLVRLVFNPAAGVLYDRLPRRPLLLSALALGAVSTAGYAIASGPAVLLLGRVLWGAAWSGLWIGGNSVVLDLASEENRGRLSARLQMWFFVGGGVAFLAGGAFTDLLGYRQGLLASAVCSAAGFLLWLLRLPETRAKVVPAQGRVGARAESALPLDLAAPRADRRQSAAPPTSGRSQTASAWAFPWRQALPASIPIFSIRLVFAGVMASTTILWLEAFVGRELELGPLLLPLATLTGAFSSLRLGTSIAGAPLGGWLSDRLRRRWAVIAGSLLLSAAGVALMAETAGMPALLGALLASLAAGSAQALAPALAGDEMQPAQRSRGLSVIYSVGDLGSALGPPLALGLLPLLSISGVYLLSATLLLATVFYAAAQTLSEHRSLSARQPIVLISPE